MLYPVQYFTSVVSPGLSVPSYTVTLSQSVLSIYHQILLSDFRLQNSTTHLFYFRNLYTLIVVFINLEFYIIVTLETLLYKK